MTPKEWRNKRIHRRGVFCKHYKASNVYPWMENFKWCNAKQREVKIDTIKPFCRCFEIKEGKQ